MGRMGARPNAVAVMSGIAVAALMGAAVADTAAVEPPAAAVVAQGAAKQALETWVRHLNAASDAELQAYVASAFAEAFFDEVPLDRLMAFHRQLRGAAPFEVDTIESESAGTLVALLRGATDSWFRARLSVVGDPPRFDGLLVRPASPPAGSDSLSWATLDELAAGIAARFDLPGVAVAWARLGTEPEIGVAGVRAAGSDAAVRPGDRFHIGSITKSVTSTALAALAEDGTLLWDATLAELLPGVEMNDAFAGVELRRLVRHRAGIQQHLTMDGPEMARLNGLPGDPTEQRAAYAAEVLQEEALDDAFHYSNAGYAVAGYIGERLSGMSWADLVRREVFEPLGLATCGVDWPATPERPDQPRGHYGGRGARRVQELTDYELGPFIEPAGDVHCSVGDLARYGLAHLAGLTGLDGFLKAATIQELHRVLDDAAPYAAGWGVDPDSGQHRHNGSAGTFFSYLTIDPRARIVVAFLTNAGPQDGQPAANLVAEAILERYVER